MLCYWRGLVNKALAGSLSLCQVKEGLNEGFLARNRAYAERQLWWEQVLSEDLAREMPDLDRGHLDRFGQGGGQAALSVCWLAG